MNTKFKTYLAVASFLLTTANYQPIYAGEWGTFIGAVIGAIFGNAVEEASKEPYNEPSSGHYCVHVDKESVKSAVVSKIDNLCQPHRQSYEDQEKIRALRSRVVESIYHKIDSTCYTSQTQVQQDCDNQAKDKVAQYISGLAQEYALNEGIRWQQRPPVNSIYVNALDPHEFAQNVAQQIAYEVQQQYTRNYYGSLQDYWGNTLKSKIAALAQQRYQRSTPTVEPQYIDCAKIEREMMNRIDRLCATSQQNSAKQHIIAQIKQKAREQLMYDIRRKQYASHQEAQADAVQKLNSFLPEILQDYASVSQKAYVKQRAIEALERNTPNALKFLISDELY